MALSAVLVLLLAQAPQADPGALDPGPLDPEMDWGRREAQHLWNRAGFGADRRDIERAVALGRDAFLAELLTTDDYFDEPFYARTKSYKNMRGREGMAPDDLRERKSMVRKDTLADQLWRGRYGF